MIKSSDSIFSTSSIFQCSIRSDDRHIDEQKICITSASRIRHMPLRQCSWRNPASTGRIWPITNPFQMFHSSQRPLNGSSPSRRTNILLPTICCRDASQDTEQNIRRRRPCSKSGQMLYTLPIIAYAHYSVCSTSLRPSIMWTTRCWYRDWDLILVSQVQHKAGSNRFLQVVRSRCRIGINCPWPGLCYERSHEAQY